MFDGAEKSFMNSIEISKILQQKAQSTGKILINSKNEKEDFLSIYVVFYKNFKY